MSENLYFAYGSNLNREDLARWCAGAGHGFPLGRVVTTACLPDWDLVFNHSSRSRGGGGLNVVRGTGCAVPGVVFHVLPEGWAALDEKEGAPNLYRRIPVTVISPEGKEMPAFTHQANPEQQTAKFFAPAAAYVDVVRQGLNAHGLSTTHLEAASQGLPHPALIDHLFVYGKLMRGECRHPLLLSAG